MIGAVAKRMTGDLFGGLDYLLSGERAGSAVTPGAVESMPRAAAPRAGAGPVRPSTLGEGGRPLDLDGRSVAGGFAPARAAVLVGRRL
jgi:hypothetical protein